MAELEQILEKVRARVTPTPSEKAKMERRAEEFRAKVEAELERMGLEAEVSLEGSVAKDTWLRGDVDIDLFMLVPPEVSRETLSTAYLEAAKRSLKGYRIVERFAEHPYVEAWITRSLRVNVVPCYKVEPPNWRSATDRTPYHTRYVKARLGLEARDEVRLLKRFMKGVGVYGSDIKVGGFSGYLAELLIIAYGGFLEVLRAASTWKMGEIIDVEGFYEGRRGEAEKLFEGSCLTVVDPVDRARNVASSLRLETFSLFRAASKLFTSNPSLKFFYPPKPRPPPPERLGKLLKSRGSDLVFLVFEGVRAVPDVLWGQLYKTERKLKRLLEGFDFKVLRSASWSDEEKVCVIVYEVEASRIPSVKRHTGPPISSPEEENFLAKHVKSRLTVSGPYIEENRWMVLLKRKQVDAKRLLEAELVRGREIGVASRLAEALKRGGLKIYVGSEILKFYRRHQGFRTFLAGFLSGRPPWLRFPQ